MYSDYINGSFPHKRMVGRSFKFYALWNKSLLNNLTRHVLFESEARNGTDVTRWNSTSSNRNLLFRFLKGFFVCAQHPTSWLARINLSFSLPILLLLFPPFLFSWYVFILFPPCHLVLHENRSNFALSTR